MASSALLENYNSIVETFCEFLTVAIHLILYERDIYPQRSFLKVRKYNYPVRQNRHPAVCKFIDDAAAAIKVQLLKCVISSVSLILISPSQVPVERYIFNTSSFPTVGPKEQYIPFMLAKDKPDRSENTTTAAVNLSDKLQSRLPQAHTHISDLHSQYTSVLERLSTLASSLKRLPTDSSFTLAVELRETPRGEPPIGWPMPFIPAEPGLQRRNADEEDVVWTVIKPGDADSEHVTTQETSSGLWSSSGDDPNAAITGVNSKGKMKAASEMVDKQVDEPDDKPERMRGKYLGGTKSVPIRHVEAGPFMMEVWVERNELDTEISSSGYKSASVEDE